MIDFSPSQKKTVAAGVTVLSFSVVVAFVFFVGWGIQRFLAFASPALTPVITGLFLSLLFKPYYDWLLKHLRNPTLSLLLMCASLLIPLGLCFWWGGSFLVDQIIHLIKFAPTLILRLSTWVNSQFPSAQTLLTQVGTPPESLPMLFLAAPEQFSNLLISNLGATYGTDALKAGMGVIKYLLSISSLLISLIFFVFFLMRAPMQGSDYVRQLPFLKDSTRAFVARQIDAFLSILVNFFQRQVVICLIEGLYYGLGFLVVGLPYGFILGFLLGVFNLVPLLGTVIFLPLALPLAYFGEGGSLMQLSCVLGVWLAGQFLDGYLITPKIQGDKTGLGYAGVIFSFFFWGIVFHSMLGLLLAIPLSAFCVVLWRALKETYIKGVI